MFNIVDYGAVGDGATLNTKAIQATVDACAAAGGGQVVVPAGIFVSGPIFLKSNIELHLSPGAVLRGSRNMDDYPLLDNESHGYHIDHWLHASLLTGYKLENVAITGMGILDGQGDVWWQARDNGTLKHIRPSLIYLCDCERTLIDGVKLTNSPSYNILPLFCCDVIISDVVIKNPWKPYYNTDGIDLYSCNNVRISNCYIDTGDDGICLKSVPEDYLVGASTVDYSKPRVPCENVIITNCVVEHAHSGVGIWAEVIGGLRNVAVSNCVFDGTRTGIRINRFFPWTGGFVHDVRVDNIIMRQVEYVFEVSNYWDPTKIDPNPDRDTTPVFSNIQFSNITATQARIACEMFGMPNMPVRDICFSNILIEADKGFDLRNAENITLDNVTVTCPGPALQAEGVRNLDVQRLTAPRPRVGIPVMQFTDVSDAWVHGCTAAPGTDVFVGLVGEKNRDIVLGENRLTHAKQAQAPVEPVPIWSSTSYAYSGSAMWRKPGDRNLYLPVPPAVWETITREWSRDQIAWAIHGIHRLESGAHPELVLNSGATQRIYIILADGTDEQLIILEDGTLLRKAKNFKWQLQ